MDSVQPNLRSAALSIIIPMRNEEEYVGRCLDSVLRQLGDRHDVEILCVDGASTDRTPAIVAEYAQRDPRIRLLHNPRRIVPVAMNRALSEARGDVIVRLDCHSEYAPDYLEQCLAVLRRTGADNVGGYISTRPGCETRVGWAIAAATSSRFGVGDSAFRVGGQEREVDTVPFGCFRRDVFTRFGLYDERLERNQDIELNHRIRKGGGRIVISPAIRLTYYTRSTLAGLRQQAFHNGAWNAYTLYLVGAGLRPRHFVPLLCVVVAALLFGTGFAWRPAWGILALLVGVYLVLGLVLAIGAARRVAALTADSRRSRGRLFPALILLAFLNLHAAYGLGSLWGLVSAPFRFGLRRSKPIPVLTDRPA